MVSLDANAARDLIAPLLGPVGGNRSISSGGGSGATGSWLADRATTVLDDFEPVALRAATVGPCRLPRSPRRPQRLPHQARRSTPSCA